MRMVGVSKEVDSKGANSQLVSALIYTDAKMKEGS